MGVDVGVGACERVSLRAYVGEARVGVGMCAGVCVCGCLGGGGGWVCECVGVSPSIYLSMHI